MSPPAVQPMMALELGRLVLALPLQILHSLEPVVDLLPVRGEDGRVGELARTEQRWPVFSFDDELNVCARLPPAHRICALLTDGAQAFGLTCSSVAALTTAELRRYALAPCLLSPDTPISGLLMASRGMLCESSFGMLAQHLHSQCVLAGAQGKAA